MAAVSVRRQVMEKLITPEWMARVGTALALKRFRKGLSRRALAEKAEVDIKALEEIESGDGPCSDSCVDVIKAACSAIDSTLEELYKLSLSCTNAAVRHPKPRNVYVRKARPSRRKKTDHVAFHPQAR